MPALNFKKQFIEPIESGDKIHTIRAKRQDGRDPRPGQTLFLYFGQRTKHCQKLAEKPCKRVRDIKLQLTANTMTVTIDGERLNPAHKFLFARADGFDGRWTKMHEFFWKYYGGPHMPPDNDILTLDEMLLIQWADTVY